MNKKTRSLLGILFCVCYCFCNSFANDFNSIPIEIKIEGYDLKATTCVLGKYKGGNYFSLDTISIKQKNKISTSVFRQDCSGFYMVYIRAINLSIPFVIDEELDNQLVFKVVIKDGKLVTQSIIEAKSQYLLGAPQLVMDSFLQEKPNSFLGLTSSILKTLSASGIDIDERIAQLPYKDSRLLQIPVFVEYLKKYTQANYSDLKKQTRLMELTTVNRTLFSFVSHLLMRVYREDTLSYNYCAILKKYNENSLPEKKIKFSEFCD